MTISPGRRRSISSRCRRAGDVVQVVIVLAEGWTGSDAGLAILQAKVHNAVGFATGRTTNPA
jgi:hypothetical protein